MRARTSRLEDLLARLPHGSDAVLYPDHPLLFRGPDILVAHERSLVAFFVSTTLSGRTSSTDRARALLSRFALPPTATLALVLPGGASADDADENLFDVVYTPQDTRGTIPLPGSQASGTTKLAALGDLHHERFTQAWVMTMEAVAPTVPPPRRTSAQMVWERQFPLRAKDLDFHEDHLILAASPRTRREAMIRLATAAASAARLDYALDSGREEATKVALLLRRQDIALATHVSRVTPPPLRRGFDRLKPLRAAAFAGFATIGPAAE